MRRIALAPIAGVLLLALLPGSVAALVPGDLDQHSELVPHSLGAQADQAQTFTAGKTGSLNDVELYFNGTGTITVTIQSTASGLPTGTVLATSPVTITSANGWIDFAFASPASVTSGVMYAIVFNTGALAAVWGTDIVDPDNYVPGRALQFGEGWVPNQFRGDFAFRTYVSTAAATATPATPAPTRTAPPTSTRDLSSSGTPSALMLLAGLAAFSGAVAVILTMKRRRLFRG